MANLKEVVYLTNEDYNILASTGTVTIDGDTLTYDPENTYITPEPLATPTTAGLMSAADKAKLDNTASMIEVTYSVLKTLRDNSQLIPGAQYRITDYECTTTTANTSSAGHAFDIVVIADSVNTLNECAHAALHDGDTYFASQKLEAWQLWYCLDNSSRFEWADSTNGKGVIYRMIDEYGNDLPYDFKNIVYSHETELIFTHPGPGKLTLHRSPDDDANTYYAWRPTAYMTSTVYYVTSSSPAIGDTLYSDSAGTSSGYTVQDKVAGYSNIYTFADGTSDGSIPTSSYVYVHHNIMKPVRRYPGGSGGTPNQKDILPFNIFYRINGGITGSEVAYNVFEINCYNNMFGYYCSSNYFGPNCCNNTFGNSCGSNKLSDGCSSMKFGNNCTSNILYSSCDDIQLGNGSCGNIFGIACRYSQFGENCSYNVFGYYCNGMKFGTSFSYNTIGKRGSYIQGGNTIQYNTLGDDVAYVIFGTSTGLENYYQYNIIESGCNTLFFTSSDSSGTVSNQIQYTHIHAGVRGTSSGNRRTISTPDRNLSYSLDYYAPGSQQITLT